MLLIAVLLAVAQLASLQIFEYFEREPRAEATALQAVTVVNYTRASLIASQENLRLATQIENAQKAKLENERNLLTRGRTSTYQILVFEQEYSNSELTTQQIAQKLHELIAEQKLYQQSEI